MSMCYFKHTITYDTGCGYSDTAVIYEICNNSCDYMSFKYENGDVVELRGPDDFIKCLRYILNGEEAQDEWWGSVKSEEIRWVDLPEKVRP